VFQSNELCSCQKRPTQHGDRAVEKEMKKSAPIAETVKALNRKLEFVKKPKMGNIFGKDVQNILISQAASGGQATAEIQVPVPIWEIIIIAIIVSIIVHFVSNCVTRQAKKSFEKKIQKINIQNA
jgi:hypothetical protein